MPLDQNQGGLGGFMDHEPIANYQAMVAAQMKDWRARERAQRQVDAIRYNPLNPDWANADNQILYNQAQAPVKYIRMIDGQWVKCDKPTPSFPKFDGWERIEEPSKMRDGDIYVCLDKNEPGYQTHSTPWDAVKTGRSKVILMYGDPAPSPGWAVYRKNRSTQIRLMPNPHFSKQLPLP